MKHVITLDALHCQKKTLALIIDSGNDYSNPKSFMRIYHNYEVWGNQISDNE